MRKIGKRLFMVEFERKEGRNNLLYFIETIRVKGFRVFPRKKGDNLGRPLF